MGTRAISVLLVLTLITSALPAVVSGDTVIRSETVDLSPAGTFEDSSEWTAWSNKAYSEESADFTTSMIADGRLSMTHNRPSNYNEVTSWASYSPTNDNLSIGQPDCFKPATNPVCDNDLDGDSDGGYSWSKGPIIELAGFDWTGGVDQYQIVNVSLAIAFRIPDSLQQDSVQFIVDSDGNQHLVKTYAHTMGEVNHMNYNTRVFSLDGIKSWSWSELSNIRVLLDYVSVGEFDDTELQIDAAGIIVKHLQPWGTFEIAKASHSMAFDEFPILEADLNSGSAIGMDVVPCGLQKSAASNDGEWTSEPMQLPHGQSWGRFHPNVDGNASWMISNSINGESWSSPTNIDAGSIISEGQDYVRFHATLVDGCLQGLTVDINNPTLSIEGQILGEIHSMVPDFSKLRVAMNGEEILAINVSSEGGFNHSVSVGHLLPAGGGEIEIGLATRFHWSSDGRSENIVVQVEDISIDGGYLIEWDRDPQCEAQSDQFFEEDGGGRLLDFLYTCSDDITTNSALLITATSADPSILDASEIDGQIRLQPVADASGQTTVSVVVTDERLNTWSDEFSVQISAVDDPPEMDMLPVEITMELNQPMSIEFSYWDRDTPSSELDIEITPNWASFSGGYIIFEPTQFGTQVVTVKITDGSTEIEQSAELIVTQRADLWVQSIDIFNENTGDSSINQGNDIAIYVYVRNSGNSIAQPVNIRCSVNGQTFGTPQIAVMQPGDLSSAICDKWNLLGLQSGEVTLEVEIDWTGDIDETNEVNNVWSGTIVVNSVGPETNQETNNGGALSEYSSYMWVGVIILGLLGILVFMYGPNQIQKIE
ncbi:MAG: CARDB domain-containing protein [Candidatus Thermoplasmatota archaeon]|nr:CARDB domain-containing protein [Candidatus Thermoplasmatota archaeon]